MGKFLTFVAWFAGLAYLLLAIIVLGIIGGIAISIPLIVAGIAVLVKTIIITKNQDGHMMGRIVAAFTGGIIGALIAPLVAASSWATDMAANIDEAHLNHDNNGLVALQGFIAFVGYGLPAVMLLFYTFGQIRPRSSPFRDHGIGDIVISTLAGVFSACVIIGIPLIQQST